MKQFSILTILVLVTTPLFVSGQKNFQTQGEQEDYWAEQIFSKDYKKRNFERFNGTITKHGKYAIYYDSTV